MYTETGLVPTGVLNPFRSIYTSYPDLVHLLCVTRSTALRPLNCPSAFSHEPLIHRTPLYCVIYIIIFFFVPHSYDKTISYDIYFKLLPILSCYNCCRTNTYLYNIGTRAHTGTVSHDGRPIIQFAGARKPEIKSHNAYCLKLFKSFPIALLRYRSAVRWTLQYNNNII